MACPSCGQIGSTEVAEGLSSLLAVQVAQTAGECGMAGLQVDVKCDLGRQLEFLGRLCNCRLDRTETGVTLRVRLAPDGLEMIVLFDRAISSLARRPAVHARRGDGK